MRQIVPLPDLNATERLGIDLAQPCAFSDAAARVLYLSGELGSGKTTLAAALLQALGVEGPVRSPTYSLLELYELPRGLALHADLYRLQQAEELEQLGLRDYLGGRALLLIEWPERGHGYLPPPDLHLRLETRPVRSATIEAVSPPGRAWLARAQASMTSAPAGVQATHTQN
jgi:tRNA threonylcarbamoyladenosine biosynthesis protein TsaE